MGGFANGEIGVYETGTGNFIKKLVREGLGEHIPVTSLNFKPLRKDLPTDGSNTILATCKMQMFCMKKLKIYFGI